MSFVKENLSPPPPSSQLVCIFPSPSSFSRSWRGPQEALADDGFDDGGGEVAELVGEADEEGAKGGREELEEMDGDGG